MYSIPSDWDQLIIFEMLLIYVPDNRLTEMVVAFIQLNHNWIWAGSGSDHTAIKKEQCISSETLQQFCRTNNLTGFKVPKRYIRWGKKFPLTTSGKLRRDQLKSEIMLKSIPSNL
ncbi:hypothetical protein SSX86_029373 [Deinandra increscens subsp. villosa]|uniref:Uncharacterized protein n=1 Tax=Deinandra increscens subsp. villosa TaxID=3103831 RepID=A0AAP0CCG1_9ASTR